MKFMAHITPINMIQVPFVLRIIILHKYNYLLMAQNLVIMVWISVYLYACKRTQQLEQIFLSLNICTSKEQTVR